MRRDKRGFPHTRFAVFGFVPDADGRLGASVDGTVSPLGKHTESRVGGLQRLTKGGYAAAFGEY